MNDRNPHLLNQGDVDDRGFVLLARPSDSLASSLVAISVVFWIVSATALVGPRILAAGVPFAIGFTVLALITRRAKYEFRVDRATRTYEIVDVVGAEPARRHRGPIEDIAFVAFGPVIDRRQSIAIVWRDAEASAIRAIAFSGADRQSPFVAKIRTHLLAMGVPIRDE